MAEHNDNDEADEEVTLDDDTAELARRYAEAAAAIVEWGEVKEKVREQLLSAVGTARVALVDGHRAFTVSRSRPRRFDKSAFAADHPGLYEDYTRAAEDDEVRLTLARGFGRAPL